MREKPNLNLALIYDEGTVWHFTMNTTEPIAQKKLFKLPKSYGYFGYSDDKGIIYFINSNIKKPITQFHKTLNNKGIKTIPNSGFGSGLFKESLDYSKGTLLGIGYLLFEKLDDHYSEKETEESYSWSDLVSGKILNSENVIFQFSSLRLTVIDLS